MGLEWPRDVCRDEQVAPAEAVVQAVLSLDLGEGGLLPQASRDLSAVLNHKQTEVAVSLLEHEVVCLPYLLWGGLEWEPGICEARFGESGVNAVLRAFLRGFCFGEVGGDCLAQGGSAGRHGG